MKARSALGAPIAVPARAAAGFSSRPPTFAVALLAFAGIAAPAALAAAPAVTIDPATTWNSPPPTSKARSTPKTTKPSTASNTSPKPSTSATSKPANRHFTGAPQTATESLPENAGLTPVNADLTALEPETPYYFRLVASNESALTSASSGAPFHTKGPITAPLLEAVQAEEVLFTTATAKAEVTAGNADPGFNSPCFFQWITDQQFEENDRQSALNPSKAPPGKAAMSNRPAPARPPSKPISSTSLPTPNTTCASSPQTRAARRAKKPPRLSPPWTSRADRLDRSPSPRQRLCREVLLRRTRRTERARRPPPNSKAPNPKKKRSRPPSPPTGPSAANRAARPPKETSAPTTPAHLIEAELEGLEPNTEYKWPPCMPNRWRRSELRRRSSKPPPSLPGVPTGTNDPATPRAAIMPVTMREPHHPREHRLLADVTGSNTGRPRPTGPDSPHRRTR